MSACGIEGPWRRNVSPPGWWTLPIAAREPDPRSIRQNYVTSSMQPAAESKDLGAAAVRSGDLEDWKMGNVETEKSRTEVGVTDRAEEDGKMGGASSGLRIARIVGTTEVAATAQQGVVTSLAHSDRRVAAVARMEEGAEGTAEVAATAQQGAVTPVAHSNGRAAAEGSEGWQMGNAGAEAAAAAGGAAEDGPGAATEAAAGTAAGVRPPRPADWDAMTRFQKKKWKKRGGKWQTALAPESL